MNTLYFGDNLAILRENLHDESVDLIYLDPPFNSKRDYNLIFKCPKGHASDAQITAFEDSWHWNGEAQREFMEVLHGRNTQVAELVRALRSFLGDSDLMAYLVMMANRLVELHRVLKLTGSLYLHCDPMASHYLKVVLDGVFGKAGFRTEISWKRSSAHNDAKQGRRQYGNIRDVIFFYTKSAAWTWNWLYTPYDPEYIEAFYRHVEPNTGRRYRLSDLTAAKPGGDTLYPWKGVLPYKGRYWAYSKAKMEEFESAGRLVYTKNGMPNYRRYLDEMPGVPLQNDWNDIQPASGKESLGYSTQKPLALLERIIQASSDEGDVCLDPFAGCGTAIHASHKLKRRWVGIDITHLAIALVERRLKGDFPGLQYEVIGTPKDLEGARALAARDKYQFQWWACALVGAQPYQDKKKGADGGVDGLIYFQDEKKTPKKIIVSIKGGENITLTMLKDLIATVEGQKAQMGLFVTLAVPTRPMVAEAARAGYYQSPVGKHFPKIQILTIEGLLDDSERPRYPDLAHGSLTFNQTKREKRKEEQIEILGL